MIETLQAINQEIHTAQEVGVAGLADSSQDAPRWKWDKIKWILSVGIGVSAGGVKAEVLNSAAHYNQPRFLKKYTNDQAYSTAI